MMPYVELTEQHLKAIGFYAAERLWRANLVLASSYLPAPERLAYMAERDIAEAIMAAVDHHNAQLGRT